MILLSSCSGCEGGTFFHLARCYFCQVTVIKALFPVIFLVTLIKSLEFERGRYRRIQALIELFRSKMPGFRKFQSDIPVRLLLLLFQFSSAVVGAIAYGGLDERWPFITTCCACAIWLQLLRRLRFFCEDPKGIECSIDIESADGPFHAHRRGWKTYETLDALVQGLSKSQ